MAEQLIKTPAWGFKHYQPDLSCVYAAFGCRMIDTSQERMAVLHDRKELTFRPGMTKAEEKAMVPEKQFKRALKLLEEEIDPYRQTDKVYVIKDRIEEQMYTTTYASQNSSYGYVYLMIWVTDKEQDVPENAIELKPRKKNECRTNY